MKVLGILLLVVAGLMLLSSVNLAVTKYNLSEVNDMSKLCGGIGFSALIGCVGAYLLRRARKKDKPSTPAPPQSGEEPKKE